jgi:hypothetical protein
MRSFLINKNLCIYYWLRKRASKKQALLVANAIERIILVFGREVMPIQCPIGRRTYYSPVRPCEVPPFKAE